MTTQDTSQPGAVTSQLINFDHASPNFWNLPGEKIEAVCGHGTDDPHIDSVLSWLCSTASQVSSNYVIDLDGTIYCLVDPYKGNRAWANGIVKDPDMSNPLIAKWINAGINPNWRTISIEHVADGMAMRQGKTMPAAQQSASLWLIDKLMTDFNIPRNGLTFIGHKEIDSIERPYCPGVIDIKNWNDRLAALAAVRGTGTGTGTGGTAKVPDLNDPNNPTGRWVPTATGYEVNNGQGFLAYWLANGGLSKFGFPESGARPQIDPATGQPNPNIIEQYFERARLELHLDDKNIYQGRVGAELLALLKKAGLAPA